MPGMHQLSHRHLTIHAEVGPVVVHTVGATMASWVLLMSTSAAIAMDFVSLKFPCFPQSGCHGGNPEDTSGVTLSLGSPWLRTVGLCSTALSFVQTGWHWLATPGSTLWNPSLFCCPALY